MQALQKIINDAEIASEVLLNQGPHVLQTAIAQSQGYGVLNNCLFVNFNLLVQHGLSMYISESRDGRIVLEIYNVAS